MDGASLSSLRGKYRRNRKIFQGLFSAVRLPVDVNTVSVSLKLCSKGLCMSEDIADDAQAHDVFCHRK